MNAEIAASFSSAVMFTALGDLLRHAMAKQYMTYDDLYTTDTAVLTKVRAHTPSDSVLRQLLDRLEGRVHYCNDPKNYDTKVSLKSRIVDPLCRHERNVVRLSDVQPDWGDVVRAEMQPKEYFVKWSKLSFDQKEHTIV